MATTGNPYATSLRVGGPSDPSLVDTQNDQPRAEFAVEEPSDTSNKWYQRVFGWAPRLSPNETPDVYRTGTAEPLEMRPTSDRAPEEWYDPIGANTMRRHEVEDQDADGWTEQKSQLHRAPDPRWIPTEEPRPTTRMAPRSYSFTRPFDQQNPAGARSLNGLHFSMADNMRTYDILGMAAPRHTTRNTYRLDPVPWDADMVDMPAQTEPTVIPGRVTAVNVTPNGNRAWRL
jgi:hypothetical protein